jgi:prevent-host-death family protein
MEKVTISQLKNRLSAFLKKVRAGQTILVFDRDQPVARLERIKDEGCPDDRLSRLERNGLLRRSTGRLPLETLQSPAPEAKQSVVQALLDERQEAR